VSPAPLRVSMATVPPMPSIRSRSPASP
jgi:hypothetical protein